MIPTEEQLQARTRWVLALRSGKYSQTSQSLKDGTDYCCLGVACDINDIGKFNDLGAYTIWNHDKWSLQIYHEFPPNEIMALLGFIKDDPCAVTQEHGSISLTMLNDRYNYSFQEIADVIEQGGPFWNGTTSTYGLTAAPTTTNPS